MWDTSVYSHTLQCFPFGMCLKFRHIHKNFQQFYHITIINKKGIISPWHISGALGRKVAQDSSEVLNKPVHTSYKTDFFLENVHQHYVILVISKCLKTWVVLFIYNVQHVDTVFNEKFRGKTDFYELDFWQLTNYIFWQSITSSQFAY